MGRVPPTQQYIDLFAEMRTKFGLKLIADEVVAFRSGFRGCMDKFKVHADLTCLGKIIGGGFPVGAVAGPKDVMSVFESGREKAKLPHGGTFNANPVTMAAGYAAMEMMTESEFARINHLGNMFRAGIKDVLSQVNVTANIQGQDSIFALEILDPLPIETSQKRGSMRNLSGPEADLINNGYFISAGMHGAISTAMDEDDVAPFCETLHGILKAL